MNAGGLAVMGTTLCVSAALAWTLGPRPHVRVAYNATESAAVGLYTVEPTGRAVVGDQVLSRLPPPVATLADRRRYIPATTPVLKTVAATAGAVICRSGVVVSLDGRTIAQARILDRAGRLLPVWSGCHRLGVGEVLLLGPHPDSFDGRYFGPTPTALIVGRARPLWTW